MSEENIELYNHKQFSDRDSIRLLMLQPGEYHDDVEISLIEAPLTNLPEFEALSYVWGTDPPSTPVFCGNQKILVTSNCVLALRRLRRKRPLFRSKRTCRILWIDAICINQNSILERNHQVQLMGQIYSKAKRVVIWLGEANTLSDFAMSFCSDYYKILYSKWPQFIRKYLLDLRIQKLKEHDDDGVERSSQDMLEDVIGSIIDRPWFRRLWTVQEYVLSREAYFLCGSKILHSSKIFTTLSDIGERQSEGKERPFAGVLNKHVQLYDNLKSRRFLKERDPMVSMLSNLRWQNVSNPKDTIFGIYGLRHLYPLDIDPPDYSKSLVSIQMNATKAAMLYDKSLRVLLQSGAKRNPFELPSWSPDWSSLPEGLQQSFYQSTRFEASRKTESIFKFSNQEKFLRARGVKIDYIERCSKSSSPRFKEYQEKMANEDNSSQADTETQKLLGKFADNIKSWKILAESLTSYPAGGNAEDAFFQALAPGFQPDAIKFFCGLKGLIEVSKEDSEDIPNQDSEDPFFDNLSITLRNAIEAVEPEVLVETALSMTGSNWYTDFFITSGGYIGKGFPEVEEGDSVLLIAGVECPIIGRRVGSEYLSLGPAYIEGVMNGEKWPEDDNELEDIVFC